MVDDARSDQYLDHSLSYNYVDYSRLLMNHSTEIIIFSQVNTHTIKPSPITT